MLKRHLRLLPGAAALAGTSYLIAPALGFTISGPGLPLTERDVRLYNNFADPQANDQFTTHPMFPGATGAEIAVWKAVVEWGSQPHGDGTGDPTQAVLGSGGANFDFSWQGLATGPGGPSDNIISASDAVAPGTLSTTETVFGPGWRIRLNDASYVWDDNPFGLTPGTDADIQGVTTIALGFALGLGLSSVPGATMQASTVLTSDMISKRSIEADDRAGLQTLYGVAADTKPRLTAAFVDAAGVLTLTGEGFAPTLGEVWATQAGSGGSGAPVKTLGVSSSADGTLIRVAAHPGAGAGDVLVKGSGSSGAALSNAMPLDPAGDFPSCGAAGYGGGIGGANLAKLDPGGPTPTVGGSLDVTCRGSRPTGRRSSPSPRHRETCRPSAGRS